MKSSEQPAQKEQQITLKELMKETLEIVRSHPLLQGLGKGVDFFLDSPELQNASRQGIRELRQLFSLDGATLEDTYGSLWAGQTPGEVSRSRDPELYGYTDRDQEGKDPSLVQQMEAIGRETEQDGHEHEQDRGR